MLRAGTGELSSIPLPLPLVRSAAKCALIENMTAVLEYIDLLL